MSETRKKKYDMTNIHMMSDRDGEITRMPVYEDKAKTKELKSPIVIKGPEELEQEGEYQVIPVETTKERETDR